MTPFVLLAHSRSGSSVLQEGLKLHPAVHCYGELFHDRLDRREAALDGVYAEGEPADVFCRDQIFARPPKRDNTAVGFKLFYYHARQDEMAHRLWRYLAELENLRVILLERVNLFDCVVSHHRANRAGQWRLAGVDRLEPSYLEGLYVPESACTAFFRQTLAGMTMMRRLFVGKRVLELTYEGLASDFAKVLRQCHRFLDVEPQDTIPPMRKMNVVGHRGSVTNYEELQRTFRLTPFSSFFA